MSKGGRKFRRSQTEPEIAQAYKRIYRRASPHNVRKAKADYHFCVVCDAEFYSIRSDAKTCSAKCRKAFSRSPAGHLARLKRLGGNRQNKKPDRTLEYWQAMKLPKARTPSD